MGKKLKDLKWASVALEGFPVSAMKENFQGFVGLEECTEYGFDKESKKPKKKKEKKDVKNKRKATEEPTTTPAVPNKKVKLSKASNKPSTKQSTKKIQLSNGFIVETCQTLKPSLTNEITTSNNKNKTNHDSSTNKKVKPEPKGKKTKLKLGENTQGTDTSIPLQDMEAWSSMQIPEEILKALAEQGFKKPTKIQELTLPTAMLGRRDILGAAETGSGKTLAFGIPILAGIMKLKAQHASGIDVYELPYKKSSVKKNKTEKVVEEKRGNAGGKNKKISVKKHVESSEDGYSSDDENDNDDIKSHNDNEQSVNNEDQDDKNSDSNSKQSEEEFLEEYDVPLRKKETSTDEGNASDDSDENYMHLSDLLDSDDLADSSNDEDDFIDNPADDETDNRSGEETDSQDEYQDEEEEDEEMAEGVNKDGIGCVKVIDNIEIPGHVVTKTGKPLYALILTPTRELAMQVSRHLISAAKYTGIRVATIVGGMAAVKQERVLSKSPEVVVATPGRLWELLRQGQPHLEQLDNIKFLAIDETDRMLERNHFEELTPLLERLNADERRRGARQNFVFSATLTMVHDLPQHMKGKKVTKRGKIINRKIQKMTPQQKIKKLVAMIGMTDPKVVDITAQNLGTAETLTECRITCTLEQKDYYLFYLLKRHPGRTIVFCNSIGSVKRLTQLFGLLKCSPLPLHASMPQRQRLKNLERFRDDARGVLVATDVAARGLDIPDVDHVIHYQVPRTAENYVHRSGRTARANKEGLTILMIEPGEALNYSKLCRTLNKTAEVPTFPVPAHILNSMRDIVTLSREVDRLSLAARRAAQETGWLDKAAREMDMVVDEDFVPIKYKEAASTKALQAKKKQLDALLSKPVFPRGFSFKYPTLNDPDALGVRSEENALQVMKKAMESGEQKREKRKGKNSQLLKLAKRLKAK